MNNSLRIVFALFLTLAGGCAGTVRYQHGDWTVGVGLKYEPQTAEENTTLTAGLALAERE
jgi:hypothetical protein